MTAERGRRGTTARRSAALWAILLLSACAGPRSAEEFEVANMHPANFVPKSSPASFVGTFERHCLDRMDAPKTIGPSLLAADYVRAPPRFTGGREIFVVDDRRPSVMLASTPTGTFCGVLASSRTGQTARARRLVAARFPEAVPVEAPALAPGMEAAWRVGSDGRTLVFLRRQGVPVSPASLTLAAMRPR